MLSSIHHWSSASILHVSVFDIAQQWQKVGWLVFNGTFSTKRLSCQQ